MDSGRHKKKVEEAFDHVIPDDESDAIKGVEDVPRLPPPFIDLSGGVLAFQKSYSRKMRKFGE